MHVDVTSKRSDLAALTHEPRSVRARRTIVLSVIRRFAAAIHADQHDHGFRRDTHQRTRC
jgi:hypothetical protein